MAEDQTIDPSAKAGITGRQITACLKSEQKQNRCRNGRRTKDKPLRKMSSKSEGDIRGSENLTFSVAAMAEAQRARPSATASFKRLRWPEGKGFLQPQGWKHTTYGIDGNNKQVQNVKAMIKRGSSLPSAMADKKL